MDIGGFIPFTLTDFPGRVAAAVFTQGCNFCCPYCHNAQLIPLRGDSSQTCSERDILAQLERHADRLGGVVVSGGEPTLQEDLGRFLREIHSLGLETKLDTNGSSPEILEQLFGQWLPSYIAMDIKAPIAKYPHLTAGKDVGAQILGSMTLIAGSGIEHEFRTTWDRSLLSARDIEDIRNLVPVGSLYRVHEAVSPPTPVRHIDDIAWTRRDDLTDSDAPRGTSRRPRPVFDSLPARLLPAQHG